MLKLAPAPPTPTRQNANKGNPAMGMRARKHAIALVMPAGAVFASGTEMLRGDRNDRFATTIRRCVAEYVQMAQWMQPVFDEDDEEQGGESGVPSCRLLLSLNVLTGGQSDDIAEMARPVAVSGSSPKIPQQILRQLDARLKEPKEIKGEAQCRTEQLMSLVAALGDASFDVSVIALADALPVASAEDSAEDRMTLASALNKGNRIQFVLLRDEEEESASASRNVLTLLRAIKQCSTSRRCSIRQIEDHALEMQGVVKEWLYAAAPSICTRLITSALCVDDNQKKKDSVWMEMTLRANFVVMSGKCDATLTRWSGLHRGLTSLRLLHFVPLASVHPTVLVGCPLHATVVDKPVTAASPSAMLRRMQALRRHLAENSVGAVVACTRKLVKEFYLLTGPSSDTNQVFLLFRMASSEEVIFEDAVSNVNGVLPLMRDEDIALELEQLRSVPSQDYNPFLYRSQKLAEFSSYASSGSKTRDAAAVEADTNQTLTNSGGGKSSKAGYNPIPTVKRKRRL